MNTPSRAAGSGVGLRNTRERLAQLYREEQRMIIERPENGGTRVRLEIPVREADDDA